MLLVVDIGNTNIKMGIWKDDKLIVQAKASTDRLKTTDEYAIVFKGIFDLHKINPKEITGVAISCVVPQIAYQVKKSISLLTGVSPLEVNANTKTDLSIKIDNPETLGADLLVSGVACCELYPVPCIVISLGTATTLMVIDKDKNMRGGIIMPGMSLSLNALTQRSSLLPSIGFEAPKKVIGTNTADCMRSGSVIGTAAMIDGLCDRIEEELGENCSVIATGGLSSMTIPNCKRNITLDSTLMLKGLKIIYDKNKN